MTLYRIGHWCHQRGIPLVPKLMRNAIYLLCNSYIPSSASIGKGSVFAYGGIGMVIHAKAVIGQGCVLGQGITIGTKEGYAATQPHAKEMISQTGERITTQSHAIPTIGDHCYIGAGARILGGITIGSRCTIGVNTVVMMDLPDGSIAAGAPARIIGTNDISYRAIQ